MNDTALVVRILDPVIDRDQQRAVVARVRGHVHRLYVDPGLPPFQRLRDIVVHEPLCGRIVRRKDQVVDATAKLGPHHALSRGRL